MHSEESSTDPDDVFVNLTDPEIFWRDRQQFFQSHGYMFRSRYRPGWIPSWKLNPGIDVFHAEDRYSIYVDQMLLMDAVRTYDNKLVHIKRMRSDSNELRIATYLSSSELRADPRNHAVPILDVLVDPEDPSLSYIVMPFLRYVDNPEFDTVGSVLQCVEQLLEGMVFLHENGVAHRDCAYKNVMMDAPAMFPRGFHPVIKTSLPDNILKDAPMLPRASVKVTYYYIDFGISSHFRPDETDRLVTGTKGLDRDVPELSRDVPYDPFKVDIFILGNVFYRLFFAQFSNVDMLFPLVRRMLQPDPTARPTAVEAFDEFTRISREVWAVKRIWRPHPRKESLLHRLILDVASLVGYGRNPLFRLAMLCYLLYRVSSWLSFLYTYVYLWMNGC